MLRRGRVGLTTILVTALIAFGASPASAATKKAGRIRSGETVVLLKTSGFVRVTLECQNGSAVLRVEGLDGAVDAWLDTRSSSLTHMRSADQNVATLEKTDHVEWSASRTSLVALGQVYVAPWFSDSTSCAYTSQVG